MRITITTQPPLIDSWQTVLNAYRNIQNKLTEMESALAASQTTDQHPVILHARDFLRKCRSTIEENLSHILSTLATADSIHDDEEKIFKTLLSLRRENLITLNDTHRQLAITILEKLKNPKEPEPASTSTAPSIPDNIAAFKNFLNFAVENQQALIIALGLALLAQETTLAAKALTNVIRKKSEAQELTLPTELNEKPLSELLPLTIFIQLCTTLKCMEDMQTQHTGFSLLNSLLQHLPALPEKLRTIVKEHMEKLEMDLAETHPKATSTAATSTTTTQTPAPAETSPDIPPSTIFRM